MNTIKTSECCICSEFFSENNSALSYLYKLGLNREIKSRVLYENQRFIIIPSLGPVADCHLLVLPKKHVSSYAALDTESLYYAEKLIRQTSCLVKRKFGSSMVFEHGTLDSEIHSSASCFHAHMHIVSCPYSIVPLLRNDELKLRKINSLCSLKDQYVRNRPYFFYQEYPNYAFVMDDTIQRSQYLRILVATVLKRAETGDWKKNPGIANVNKLYMKMKNEFRDQIS